MLQQRTWQPLGDRACQYAAHGMAHNNDRRRIGRLGSRVHGIQMLQSRRQEAMLACEQHTCAAEGVQSRGGVGQ